MYVLGISGSPRAGGNTDTLLNKALEAAKGKGANTEKVVLNDLKMSGCQECENVRDDGRCIIKDDFQDLYQRLNKADAVILASPIFFGSLSAQTKIMIDRFQCIWRYKYILKKEKSKKTKPGALILVEASERKSFFENAKSVAKNFFATIGVEYREELFCTGVEAKAEVQSHPEYLEKAQNLGKKITRKMRKKS